MIFRPQISITYLSYRISFPPHHDPHHHHHTPRSMQQGWSSPLPQLPSQDRSTCLFHPAETGPPKPPHKEQSFSHPFTPPPVIQQLSNLASKSPLTELLSSDYVKLFGLCMFINHQPSLTPMGKSHKSCFFFPQKMKQNVTSLLFSEIQSCNVAMAGFELIILPGLASDLQQSFCFCLRGANNIV